jgi:hypothetical protein
MYWLIKTNSKKLEVWSESEYKNKLMKCEYYGARPFWQKIRELSPPSPNQQLNYSVGEIIPYKLSSIGKRFAVIIELFIEAGQPKFLGIDIDNKNKVVEAIV